MKKEMIVQLNSKFEDAAYEKDGMEYWLARDLQVLLDYTQWRNFLQVIDKAKAACLNSRQNVSDHFADVSKTISMPKGAAKEIEDMMLTRYACYLIAQNGDPRKEQIAFAQSYFAIQTRKQELLEERIALVERMRAREKLAATETELSGIVYQRGVDGQGFARIRSKGDQALFGGHTTFEMKKKLSVPQSRPLADFIPTITIKAKDLATEITNFNVKKNDLKGEPPITKEHVKNNQDVRELLAKSGITPEQLPAAEDVKKLERRVKADQQSLAVSAPKIRKNG
ncbi:MAG: DNA damage-inducible protein D [Candidatus Omnitrophota bacterium]|nr:DNA damage-inducible protein D [Candidatus Omnitrophota bacterium]